ncbi:cyclic lactone autoinducer peptide [Bariatricus sp. HCP28S3_C2]|uniref:cyclic lactone autoinducer peptide n=1 Tax=unclassified Bariatricus TaxID=2677046 RepID=UPI003F8B3B87
MRQNNLNERISQRIKECLDQVLQIEANTSSCAYIFQPKEPEQLKKFKGQRRYKNEKKNRDLDD